MLSGVGGIDAALLVIAADEGVMPQTREHLAILDLLHIPAGMIVLTKTDLAPDPGWLDLVEKEVRAAVAGTVMQDAPLVRVSAKNKTGLDTLISNLDSLLQQTPPRADLGRPRLPIDRVFSMSGFGTVVTGTLSDGRLDVEDEIELLPSGARGRVRGLQTHRKKERSAVPGSRTAVNISGLSTEQVRRGEVLARPGQYRSTRRLDARLRLLDDVTSPLKHADEVKFFIGASETIARVRLLGIEELTPGGPGWIQLELRDPVVAVRGDRYILRRPSPGETLGGGSIVDPQPKGRHKRFDDALLKSLEALDRGSPVDVLYEAALALNAAPAREIVSRSGLEAGDAARALRELIGQGRLIQLDAESEPGIASDALMIAGPHWSALLEKVVQALGDHHASFPLRRGMPREELKSRLKLPASTFQAVVSALAARNTLLDSGPLLALPGHEVRLDAGQLARVAALMRTFEKNPYSPPGVKESKAGIGEEVFNALVELGDLVPVSGEVVFRKADYDSMVEKIRAAIRRNGQISLAETRDLFDTSRKYAQALLEHLDAAGVTVRAGDFRKLKS
jgi:selenocysteine-specific elongation factor